MLPIHALAALARHGGMMITRGLATAALLMTIVGCSSVSSPEQMWTDAAAEWTIPGATADERLQDYQKCHQEAVDASTRSGRFHYGSGGGRRGTIRSGNADAQVEPDAPPSSALSRPRLPTSGPSSILPGHNGLAESWRELPRAADRW